MSDLELGYRLENETVKMGLNLYAMHYRDQLVVTGKINDVGEYFRQNVDNSYRTGIEADMSITLSSKFLINFNAALSRNKIKNFVEFTDDYDNGGQRTDVYARPDISFSPSAVAGSEFVYKPAPGLALALQSRYVSKQYLDNTQNEMRKLDAYFVNNLRVGYDFSILGIRNIN
ncbi:MAG: TonB-dependent receptor, partial [Pedobacter sp.]